MAHEFIADSRTSTLITVQHAAHGHRYAFRVMIKRGRRRALSDFLVYPNRQAAPPAELFHRKALTFARLEARKSGLID